MVDVSWGHTWRGSPTKGTPPVTHLGRLTAKHSNNGAHTLRHSAALKQKTNIEVRNRTMNNTSVNNIKNNDAAHLVKQTKITISHNHSRTAERMTEAQWDLTRAWLIRGGVQAGAAFSSAAHCVLPQWGSCPTTWRTVLWFSAVTSFPDKYLFSF